ncbi:uncharacterized protein LOC118465917 [Anopheles albimanus]|uniref:uncharacterized protein LOC118465917 n=1 Tax=Anopheles albimanus TaxID=7167 RepID=UPI00163FB4F3|nr:uncharacterized protein LOC118465917 [Anopheles albimanus]
MLARIVGIVVCVVLLCGSIERAMANNNAAHTSKQSYFFGLKDAADILCFSRTLAKGSSLPTDVSYTNPRMNKNINFITVAADRYSHAGFKAEITKGAIGTLTATVTLTGKQVLPYAIEVMFYCVP